MTDDLDEVYGFEDENELQPRFTKDDLKRMGKTWLEKIAAAEKREDKWIKNAEKAEAAYLADDDATDDALPSFNILHSNVETIVPSIFNSSPKPDIRPRHNNNEDEAAKNTAHLLERAIEVQ